ncbi:hypothetical protein RTM1035_17307 [Roseovarius sp. TM1035]|nr:hypothetical protein RTM1035_17307 [Roseovarius sp. TM1035]
MQTCGIVENNVETCGRGGFFAATSLIE